MEAFAAALQASALGQWAAGDAYPYANALHLLGLVMLVGGIGLVDLRVIGAFRALPLPDLSRYVTPVALAGLALMAVTGFTMFAADAEALIGSTTFRWKLAAIAMALANALLFRWRFGDKLDARPAAARVSAALSLLLWLFVAWQGRMIAYS